MISVVDAATCTGTLRGGPPAVLLVVGRPAGPELVRLATEAGFRLRETATPQQAAAILGRGLLPLLAVVDGRIGAPEAAAALLRGTHLPAGVPLVALVEDCRQRRAATEAGVEVCLDLGAGDGEVARAVVNLARLVRSLKEQSPLTGLPGNREIDLVLQRLAADPRSDFAVCYVDLDHFKAFNDRFGFRAGDEVLRAVGRVLSEALAEDPSDIDFIGHIGGDDFVMVTTADRAEALCRRVIAAFDARIRGLGARFAGAGAGPPAVTISIGVATSASRPLASAWEAAAVATEMKQAAKHVPVSAYRVDHRRGFERGTDASAATGTLSA